MVRRDLTGQRFGRLVAIEPAETIGERTRWLCRCDCGERWTVVTNSLMYGYTRSCGCLRREATAQRSRVRAWAVTA